MRPATRKPCIADFFHVAFGFLSAVFAMGAADECDCGARFTDGDIPMLSYVYFGTNNLEKAIAFYDAVLAPLGMQRCITGDREWDRVAVWRLRTRSRWQQSGSGLPRLYNTPALGPGGGDHKNAVPGSGR
jgi:hypothetical protein